MRPDGERLGIFAAKIPEPKMAREGDASGDDSLTTDPLSAEEPYFEASREWCMTLGADSERVAIGTAGGGSGARAVVMRQKDSDSLLGWSRGFGADESWVPSADELGEGFVEEPPFWSTWT